MSASESWPADKVERWPTDRLVPYVRNARTHSDAQIAQIAGSIREWGWTMPVLADESGGLIAGHCRVLAARKLGLAEIPVMVANGWTEAQKRAYVIADNKLTLNAGWDADILRVELTDLKDMGADLSLVGFSEDELADLLADRNAGLTDPDEVPEAPVQPVTILGDTWIMGDHVLTCSDTTDRERMLGLCPDNKYDCVFTSPPYGVGVDYGTYEDTIDNLRAMLPKLAALWLDLVVSGGFAVINFADIAAATKIVGTDEPCEYPISIEYWPAFRKLGWLLFTRRVWAKPNARVHSPWSIQSSRAATDWEHLWVWKKPGKPVTGRGQFSAFGVWDTSKDHGVDIGKKVHGAGMAVALVTRSLETHSRPGSYVFEPFCGTGTTIVGAHMTGRKCRAAEIEPRFCDVAITRWQDFSGQTAKLEATGQTFAETAEQRGVACQTEPNATAA